MPVRPVLSNHGVTNYAKHSILKHSALSQGLYLALYKLARKNIEDFKLVK